MAATGAETIPETLLMTDEEDNNNGGDGAGAAVAVVVEQPGATDEQLQEVTRAAAEAASTAATALVEGWKVELQARFSGILNQIDEATTARKLLEQQLKALTVKLESAEEPTGSGAIQMREPSTQGMGGGGYGEMPKMNMKFIKKPKEYDGKNWDGWHASFINFLKHSDARWKPVLEYVKLHSAEPMCEGTEALRNMRTQNGLEEPGLFMEFAEQLHEYLKSYITGGAEAIVLALSCGGQCATLGGASDHGPSEKRGNG